MPSWEDVHAVPIEESGDELVPLSLAPERILVRPAYFFGGVPGTLPECYARAEIYQRLLHAASLLPCGIRMIVLDAWRSTHVQQILFDQCLDVLRENSPEKKESEIHALATRFVARPSVDAAAPSPHATGGAVDVTLATTDGTLLDFGSPFDYPGERSFLRYFEDRAEGAPLNGKEGNVLHNRRMLFAVMAEAGFVNYHAEWWHFEYGTQRWALLKDIPKAFFGASDRGKNSFAALLSETGENV